MASPPSSDVNTSYRNCMQLPEPVSPPTRAVLNFTHRCALNCDWCYVPFESPPARREVVLNVIDRIAALGFSHITLGGGDPFQYAFISDVARKAHGRGLFVHIDTHGKSLLPTQANTKLLAQFVNLVGLPLDGSSADRHDTMRRSRGHFELIRKRIEWLKVHDHRIKINTLVSAQNIGSLIALADLVAEISPSRWSLYQFWPLGPANRVSTNHAVDDVAFLTLAHEAAERSASKTGMDVEVVARQSRRSTYPIVDHDGFVFVHSGTSAEFLTPICSVFDANARETIDMVCGPERAQAATRYLSAR